MLWENPEGGNNEQARFLEASLSYPHPKCNLLFLKKPFFFIKIFKDLFLYVHELFPLCVCLCLWRSEESAGSSDTRIAGHFRATMWVLKTELNLLKEQ